MRYAWKSSWKKKSFQIPLGEKYKRKVDLKANKKKTEEEIYTQRKTKKGQKTNKKESQNTQERKEMNEKEAHFDA